MRGAGLEDSGLRGAGLGDNDLRGAGLEDGLGSEGVAAASNTSKADKNQLPFYARTHW